MAHMTEEERDEILKTINPIKTQTGRKELEAAGSTISIRDFLYILSTIRPVIQLDPNGKPLSGGRVSYKDASGVWQQTEERDPNGIFDMRMAYIGSDTSKTITARKLAANYLSFPGGTIGGAVYTAAADQDEWKHGFFSLNPGADQAIIAAVTGKKIDLWFTYSNCIRANAGSGADPSEVIIELEDEDNVDLSGIDEIHYPSFFVTGVSIAGAWDAGLFSHHAYSATAAKAIEASITAVNAGDIVNGGYGYREF